MLIHKKSCVCWAEITPSAAEFQAIYFAQPPEESVLNLKTNGGGYLPGAKKIPSNLALFWEDKNQLQKFTLVRSKEVSEKASTSLEKNRQKPASSPLNI